MQRQNPSNTQENLPESVNVQASGIKVSAAYTCDYHVEAFNLYLKECEYRTEKPIVFTSEKNFPKYCPTFQVSNVRVANTIFSSNTNEHRVSAQIDTPIGSFDGSLNVTTIAPPRLAQPTTGRTSLFGANIETTIMANASKRTLSPKR
jgi:hypothetical protein